MSASRCSTIRADLFPAAHSDVEPWDHFRWHSVVGESCDTWKAYSKPPAWQDFQSRLQPGAVIFRTMPYQEKVAASALCQIPCAIADEPLWNAVELE